MPLGNPQRPNRSVVPPHPSDDWQVFRGLTGPPTGRSNDRSRILLVGIVSVLAAAIAVSLVVLAGRLRDRMPTLYSAARSEVAALAAKFHSEPPARIGVHEAVEARTNHRPTGHVREPRQRGEGVLPPLRPFEVYIVDGERRVLISSMGRMAVLDVATGRVTWVPADQDLLP
jgi:hypothetical protein